MADEDDLDAFFDEVQDAEADVSTEVKIDNKRKIDESEETDTAVKKQKTTNPDEEAIPTTTSALPQRRVVVAAASAAASSVSNNQSKTATAPPTTSSNKYSTPLPPPPPPLPCGIDPANQTTKDTTKEALLWPATDFVLFVGNLGPEVTEQQLLQHFSSKYPSCHRAKLQTKLGGVSKGFGFVAFTAPLECAQAIRTLDQTWLGSRPIKVKRSDWNKKQQDKERKKKGKRR